MILTLLRHGEPERAASAEERADPPLSASGRQQLEVARALVEVDGYDAVYCSPLRRARESAELLAPGVELRIDQDLAEFDRDTQEYLHWEDGADLYQPYLDGDLTPWGTTLEEFRGRIRAVVERMRSENQDGRVLAVTHGGVINNFLAMLLASDRTSIFQPRYGSLNRFVYHPAEGWTPFELNAWAER